jgi:hypothetical protein
MAGFDYGTDEEIKEPGGDFKNPSVGDHAARLRSLIHCGMFRETFNKQKKKPFPEVIAIFELKEDDDFEDDGETPLTMHKAFPLKKGDRAFMTKFIASLDPKSEANGFDDLIGKACTVNCKAGKEKDDEGNPKYVNFGGISGISPKLEKITDPLVVEGVGHCRFEDLTIEAIMELNPIKDVNMVLMNGENYSGSKAEELIKEIRKENPDFAVRKAKDEDSNDDEGKDTAAKDKPKEKESNLDDEEEF